jgi:hypothetical protein
MERKTQEFLETKSIEGAKNMLLWTVLRMIQRGPLKGVSRSRQRRPD